MKQRLSRGYTRAVDYLFDSDDDAPMPKPHRAIPPRLQPPPPKQLCAVGPARSAESTRMAKPCTERINPYRPAPQQVRSTVPATVHEVVAPPPLAVSAPKPKPAKGCNRIPPHQDPAKPGTPWPMPGISEGFDHVGDGAQWRSIAVHQYHRMCWPLWGRGVTDLRPTTAMVAGRLLRHALGAAMSMIRQVRCEHKIGMCRCPHERFFFYQEAG